MIDFVVFRGTGAPQLPNNQPEGQMAQICNSLPKTQFECHEPTWEASIGPIGGPFDGQSLNTNVETAAMEAAEYLKTRPDPVGIGGYSLGALCASRLLEGINAREFTRDNGDPIEVKFVCNIANPARRAGESVFSLVPNNLYGLHGEHKPWPNIGFDNVFEYANKEDIITASPVDSPFRLVNDGISPFSFAEGARIGDISQSALYSQLGAASFNGNYAQTAIGNLPPAVQALLATYVNPFDIRFYERLVEAFVGAVRYLDPNPMTGAHILYSTQPMPSAGGLTWSAQAARAITERYSQ